MVTGGGGHGGLGLGGIFGMDWDAIVAGGGVLLVFLLVILLLGRRIGKAVRGIREELAV